MKELKWLKSPLAIILISVCLIKLIDTFLVFSFTPALITFLVAVSLFLFGMFLNKNRKRHASDILKKVLAILLMVLCVLMQMGYFSLPFMKDAFDVVGTDAFFIHMIYVFCGHMFAD